MTRFLIYVQAEFYPWADVVVAETAEEAFEKAQCDVWGFDAVVVLPFPEDAFTRGDPGLIDGMRENP